MPPAGRRMVSKSHAQVLTHVFTQATCDRDQEVIRHSLFTPDNKFAAGMGPAHRVVQRPEPPWLRQPEAQRRCP
jgi:hypothetical protein